MTDHPAASESETLIVGYVERALLLQDAGEAIDVETLCREHPALAPAVAQALGIAPDLQKWQRRAASGDRLIGTVLRDRYELQDVLGRGAMGSVYRAHDRELKRAVAVKVMHVGILADSAEARFEREAEVLASLDHPNIVRVFDRGRTDAEVPYLVMELLDGIPLSAVLHMLAERAEARPGSRAFADATWLREAVQPGETEANYLRLASRWVADLAAGLHAAHEAGIFHRDVKPSNVFLARAGRVLLLDFGIAVRDSDATAITTDGLGTPAYMPPEQADRDKPDARCDIYSLTATLYHLLTAQPPYAGDARAVLASLTRDDPVPAARVHSGLPRDLQAILDCGMARRPGHRYATAAALEDDLRAFLDHRPVRAWPLSAAHRLWRRARRSREARAIAAVLLVVAIAAGALLWSDHRRRGREAEKAELVAHMPPLRGIDSDPADRALRDAGERREVASLLDRALELDPDDVPARLDRAAFRLDHGDPRGAAADVRHVAQRFATPYLVALADRYAALGPGADGHHRLGLDDLGEPVADQDRYAAAFHALRGKTVAGYRQAGEWLAAPAEAGYLPARDLRLLVLLVLATLEGDRGKQRDDYRAVQREALLLEGRYERQTARTRHVIGAALVGQQQYRDAIEPLRDCIGLWPRSHGARLNLGVALRSTDQHATAEARLMEALEIRPRAWRAYSTLAQIQCDRGEFDLARTTVQKLAESLGESAGYRPSWLSGVVELEQALALSRGPHRQADAVRHAELAIRSFEQAAELGASRARVELNVDLSRAVIAGDLGPVLASLLQRLERDPLNPRHIRNLALTLPATLSREHVDALRAYLHALEEHVTQDVR